ncbi:MAG TPA: iron ABC transporter permease [Limnochorda sp.]
MNPTAHREVQLASPAAAYPQALSSGQADAPPGNLLLRAGSFSVLVPSRSLVMALVAGALLACAVVWSAAVGSFALPPRDAARALLGQGAPTAILLIQQIRLPRIVAGLLAGAALGMAGCLTQTLARNRLATPNTLGVNEGAAVAILLAVVSSGGTMGPWWVGPLGGLAAAVVLILLSGGPGTRGYRFLVVGIALSALIDAHVNLILAQQHTTTAAAVFAWTVGSLSGRGYMVAVPAGMALAFLLPLVLLAARPLSALQLGEEVAASLGVPVRRVQVVVMLLAVALAGLAVGIGGPIGFVAMAAPILASRLVDPARVPLVLSGLLGALLVVAADTLGRVVASPIEVPVGVVTSILGGPFLLWVLFRETSARGF